ncbi:hypothetical protein [Qipengyuania spongiae]|uniref:DUF2189 domain-containing protein n=1 Tax=Qipengyuania spongiae TaxID=2909673 RepID=A0ABY5SV96_9SPHN|nr:hypothetical protein [Qipengyuania spongiae]UVI38477.1 hypothetical protein L1F33_09410 [Qipengyuania spongiae]
MSKHLTRQLVAEQAIVHGRFVQPTKVDRSFEMPKVLYGVTVALYLGFIAIMGIGLQSPGLLIPMVIFALFIVAGFGLPALWTRLEPDHGTPQMPLDTLLRRGIATHTGHLPGRDAAVQMLMLPALIFAWGLVTVAIAATV